MVTPETDFSNISWNWLCYQRAFSAIYQNYFGKLTLFADVIVLQIWLYTHMPSLVCFVWKTNKKTIDAMHQRSSLKKFEEKSDNTVKMCLSNIKFRLQNTILMIPNLKFMTLNLFLPSPNVLLLNHCKHYYRWWE